jgi:hypothetical protein
MLCYLACLVLVTLLTGEACATGMRFMVLESYAFIEDLCLSGLVILLSQPL